jgi:hypothetical protein
MSRNGATADSTDPAFEPEDGAVDAHRPYWISIKKLAKAIKATKTIGIKTGAHPRLALQQRRRLILKPFEIGVV